jgi:hypothetical protein
MKHSRTIENKERQEEEEQKITRNGKPSKNLQTETLRTPLRRLPLQGKRFPLRSDAPSSPGNERRKCSEHCYHRPHQQRLGNTIEMSPTTQ